MRLLFVLSSGHWRVLIARVDDGYDVFTVLSITVALTYNSHHSPQAPGACYSFLELNTY